MRLPNWKKKRVLTIGDAILDEYIVGTASRLSPEAPVPVILNPVTHTFEGGAGNVVANIRTLGAKNYGYFNGPMPIKRRIIANGKQIARIDIENRLHPITESGITHCLKYVDGGVDAIIFSDYSKGFLTREAVEKISVAATLEGIPTYADCKPDHFGWYNGKIRYIKMNEEEKNKIQDVRLRSNLIVTLGANGAEFADPFKPEFFSVKTEPVEMADVCGAGDTFMAAFVLAHISGRKVKQAMEIANAAARIAVSKKYTAWVWLEELKKAL
jgi:bifunctional ADP-heptose synthase (sugar kinase/adenylyltransferase)